MTNDEAKDQLRADLLAIFSKLPQGTTGGALVRLTLPAQVDSILISVEVKSGGEVKRD